MRNIVCFVVNYYQLLVFGVLQVICFILIYLNEPYHQASLFNSSNVIVGSIYNSWSNVTDYFKLSKENEVLLKNNTDLLNAMKGVSYIRLTPNIITIKDTVYMQQYTFIEGKVINNTQHLGNNFITVNKGSKDGIEVDMGVIGSNGIMGFVKTVSNKFCSVVTVFNASFMTAAKVSRIDFFGELIWEGRGSNRALLEGIPAYADVQIGDTITTRGGTGRYPDNSPIGTVCAVNTPQGNANKRITVKLFTDYNRTYYVYLVKNVLKLEQETLENQVTADDK